MLVIVTTHPIQYQVPLWQKLAEEKEIDFEVWYLTDFGTKQSYDVQFGQSFAWDIPMLTGYTYRLLKVNRGAAPNTGFYRLRLAEDIQKHFEEHKVTHVWINGWQVLAYWQVLWASKRAGLVTIIRGESNDLKPEVRWKWPIKKWLMRMFFNKVDFFLYIGSANKRLYEKYGVKEKKMLPSLYCVDNARFSETARLLKKGREQIKQSWNIPMDKYCFLFSGKFIEKKRPGDIIQAAKLLEQKGIQIHLLFAGSGQLEGELLKACNVVYHYNGFQSPEGSGKITASFTGFLNQSEIVKAYAAADCLVLPSNYLETWGLVVNEAMASGIRCIVSNECGCAKDLILTLDQELVFECGNIAALSNAMMHVITTAPDSGKLSVQINDFSYDNTIHSLKYILE